jgi:thiol-disulfide isomerase/thioredoxin
MKRLLQPHRRWLRLRRLSGLGLTVASLLATSLAAPADQEYTGKFEPQLVVNRDDREQIVFKPIRDLSKIKMSKPPESDAAVTAGRLYHAPSDRSAVFALLVEPRDGDPYLLADADLNNELDDKEHFSFLREDEDNPFIWQTTVSEPLKEGLFQSFPLLVRYLKKVRSHEMKEGERMILESRGAFARGSVDIQGKKTLVQYDYNPRSRKVSTTSGKLGVDCDADGEIDMDAFSPEAAETEDEAVVFRVGSVFVSTKKVDVEKNQITMRSHSASDYKRLELRMGGQVPDFDFTDFNNKKRKVSEFRGKYVLIDFWGMWCPPCRQELPYLRAAYQRFQARGFEILGMNTDRSDDVSQIKSQLEKNGMTWPQARRDSITSTIRSLRIHSYPTTVLVGPDGKILSLNNRRRDQPALRGNELLKSLDQLLPP